MSSFLRLRWRQDLQPIEVSTTALGSHLISHAQPQSRVSFRAIYLLLRTYNPIRGSWIGTYLAVSSVV